MKLVILTGMSGAGKSTALKMMEVMIAKKMTLSQLAAPLQIYPQVLKNIRVYDKTAAQDDTDVKAAVDKVAESGTEPVVRVMVEAGTHEECEKYVDDVIAVIKEKGYAVE